jgi:hypothetical protein
LHLLDREHIISLSVAKFLFYSKTFARFSGEKFSNRHIWLRSFVGGHQPTYLMNPISTPPVLWYKRIGNFFPIISKVSWIYNMH